MDQFILPSKFVWTAGATLNVGTVIIEPCYFGYGTTLGNALRRVLLSSLEGAAVTAVKIDGVSHEFSAMENVQEDIIELLLNMKQLRLKVFADEPVRMTLEVSGKREVTAHDIVPQSDVEIVNPDLHIASLTADGARLRMEIFAQRGRGYVATEVKGGQHHELGVMAIDAAYTPVRNVGFRVENARVGEITNYDRLHLTVETDGTISPQEAVARAAKTLIDHFALIVHPPAASQDGAAADERPDALEEQQPTGGDGVPPVDTGVSAEG